MITLIEQLKMQLSEAIRHLQEAEKAIDSNELPEATVRVQIAKGILMTLRS